MTGLLRVLQVDMHGSPAISSSHLDGDITRSNIWGQAVQYIDEVPATEVCFAFIITPDSAPGSSATPSWSCLVGSAASMRNHKHKE